MTTSTFKCPICNEETSWKGVSFHLRKHSLTQKEAYDKFIRKDGEGLCEVCLKPTKFVSFRYGYKSTCSVSCSNRSKSKLDSFKRTCLEKFGETAPMKSKVVKEKAKSSFQEHYGTDNYFASEECKSKLKKKAEELGVKHHLSSEEIRNKIKETCIERYGVESNLQSETIKDSIRNTCLEKYGFDHPMKNEMIKEKAKNTNLERYGSTTYLNSEIGKSLIENNSHTEESESKRRLTRQLKKEKYLSEGYIEKATLEKTCGQAWYKNLDYLYVEVSKSHLIPSEYSKYILENFKLKEGRSVGEIELFNFVKTLEKQAIKNTRKIIPPYELDIYIPEKSVAIEFNGTYWHSTKAGKDVNYHLDKTRMCENKGIRLIHIFEWEWKNKRSICESIIAGALGIYKERIKSNSCQTRSLSKKDTESFLKENSLKSTSRCLDKEEFTIGFFFKEELIKVISFKKIDNLEEIEIVHICSKLGVYLEDWEEGLLNFLNLKSSKLIYLLDRSKESLIDFKGWSIEKELEPEFCIVEEVSSVAEDYKSVFLVPDSGRIKISKA